MSKIKILWHSDLLVPTGFGNVAEEILTRLIKLDKYEFTVLGVGHDGSPINQPSNPYYKFRELPVHRATEMHDALGLRKLLYLLKNGDYDIFFALMDLFWPNQVEDELYRLRQEKKFRRVFYFPVDGDLRAEHIKKCMASIDYPVTITQYGKNKVAEHNKKFAEQCRVIYHGVNRDTFHPIGAAERKIARVKYFDVRDDQTFIMTNVNRNNQRKNLPQSIVAFLKFHERYFNSRLYLNTNTLDRDGFDLQAFIEQYVSPEIRDKIIMPNPYEIWKITPAVLNQLYCASDAIFSTTTGEGWGLSTSEAMACRVPVVMPRNTACTELIGENQERGWLAECDNHIVYAKGDNTIMRPLVNIDKLVSCLHEVRVLSASTPMKAQLKIETAYQWIVENCDWDQLTARLDALFTQAYNERGK